MQEKLYRNLIKFNNKIDKLEAKSVNATKEEAADIQRALNDLKMQKKTLTTGFSTMKNAIADAMGTRLILDDCSPEKVDEIVKRLVKGIEKDEFTITDFNNYGGTLSNTYFTKEQENALKLASAKRGIALDVVSPSTNPAEGVKKSGYTCAQMNIVYKNGVIGELQIRGSKIHELAESEHILYDIRESKDLAKGDKEIEKIVNPVVSAVKNLDKSENAEIKKTFEDYVRNYYIYTRDLELGKTTGGKPVLPNNISSVLDLDNIKEVHGKIKELETARKAKSKKFKIRMFKHD